MLVSCPRSRAMFFPDRTSCGIVVAATPRLASSCASIAAAASSRPLRAPMQRIAGRSGAASALSVSSASGACSAARSSIRPIVSSAIWSTVARSRAPRSRSCSAKPRAGMIDRVVEFLELLFLQVLVGDLGRLLGVTRQQALVELDLGRKRRLVAQQHVEETELGHVAPEHHQADGKRRREQQARRPPQRGPEHRRDQDRDRREPGARAVQPGLEDVVAEQLQDDEQRDGQER